MPPSIASILHLHPPPSSPQSILFLGEGDFSFSSSLLSSIPSLFSSTKGSSTPQHTIIPTAYDSKQVVLKKYPKSQNSLSTLLSLDLIPLFSINALSLSSPPLSRLLPPKFTKIIWMFPHSGHQRVHVNRHMLFDFFNGLEETLQEGGEVYVTLTDGRPYSDWKLLESAHSNGFKLKSQTSWESSRLPGYAHVTTLASNAYKGVNGTMESKGVLGSVVYCFGFVGKEEEKVEEVVEGKYNVRIEDSEEEEEEDVVVEEKGETEEKKGEKEIKKGEKKKKKRSRNERRKIANKKKIKTAV
ncbi:hypothetical protein TrLO_g3253 [Triparma laevis f. longispina]|uniref:25S rRNA (uridine-N(3))-methyltransferase BMT5-like domain-containing protein n=1 Tax=Triparma laevis f. longispina TaxID=1714387 RepID=A0A9W7E5Y8_9STRA|nr:hypothetical protein TrLO_g3253 [Triparma laevis f. longispina]